MKLGIGLIGCGIIGNGFLAVAHYQKVGKMLMANGVKLNIKTALVRDTGKRRLFSVVQTSHPPDILDDPEIDVMVEATGEAGGIKDLAVQALLRGKHFVTANKALVALHYPELAQAARDGGARLLFEAAVGGGVPIIEALREHAPGIRTIKAVVNGTTNFILQKVEEGKSFADALKEAQCLGFAEPNPTNDVSGLDAAYKLSILALVGFGMYVHPARFSYKGIGEIDERKVKSCVLRGKRLKLVATAEKRGKKLYLVVQPELVPATSWLGFLSGVQNGFVLNERTFLCGEGAGALPTGCSLLQDILEIAKHKNRSA